MSKRGVGLVMVLAFAAVLSAAIVYEQTRLNAQSVRVRASADALNRTLQSTQLAIANLRTAQAAYVVPGQSTDFWLKREAELSARIETGLGELDQASTSADAKAHYANAVSALGALNSLDQKARDSLTADDRTLAADVIFKDAVAAADRLDSELAAAQWVEVAARDTALRALERRQLATTGGGAAALFVIALSLAVRRRQAASGPPAVEVPVVTVPVPRAPVAAAAAPIPSPRVEPVRINLSDAAQVCVDLARVLDGADVPPLLERAARVLDAKGLVLWVADTSGGTLRASLAHGYPEKVLQRLGPLPANAENVTSLAFRSMQVQTLNGQTKGASNALAVPLITASGCIGVLSAEVPEHAARAETVSVARMFAAQLATLVAPVDAGAQERSAQV